MPECVPLSYLLGAFCLLVIGWVATIVLKDCLRNRRKDRELDSIWGRGKGSTREQALKPRKK